MSVKITSGASLQRMQNAITQASMTFNHNMEPDIKTEWLRLMAMMHACRKLAIEKNEEYEELKKGIT